jgi:hypothetical protein
VKERVTAEFEFAALEWGTGSGAQLKFTGIMPDRTQHLLTAIKPPENRD